jgi:8-oxo-dGTP pyrophosphatase MutT (NUDIX family)
VSDFAVIEKLRKSLDSSRKNLDYPFVRSAVIVPLISNNGGVQIVLELRSPHLRRSPGEVGFPGGRIEPGEDSWQAAVRELEEELGVQNHQVELLGRLPEQQRRREELVVPYVGRLSEDVQLRPDGVEVAEVFTLPLDHLLQAGFQEATLVEQHTLADDFPRQYLPKGSWKRRSIRTVYYLLYKSYLIWGLSANILVQLMEQIRR